MPALVWLAGRALSLVELEVGRLHAAETEQRFYIRSRRHK